MTDFEVGDHVKFAGGQGEITKIEDRPNGGQLLHVYTTEGELRNSRVACPISSGSTLSLTASQPDRSIRPSTMTFGNVRPASISRTDTTGSCR